MSSIQWYPGLALTIGDDAVLDYTFDFAPWLGTDTLAAATVEGEGLTAAVVGNNATTAEIRISEAGVNSKATVTIETTGGQVQSFAIYFNPESSTCASPC